ncbi:uncharacterized protein LOC115627934 [Scaptodrosophila lebanonensis]|uniref:Uncharacterized protein LOC115627934 n=1 Tax=Drosophila lebanonensis TaxID=7225 RepID=A0A6J2TXQ6_DROLE|nr:uncharacterized protein LOC115627934 [Scaptodrosophila lebanonensis]
MENKNSQRKSLFVTCPFIDIHQVIRYRLWHHIQKCPANPNWVALNSATPSEVVAENIPPASKSPEPQPQPVKEAKAPEHPPNFPEVVCEDWDAEPPAAPFVLKKPRKDFGEMVVGIIRCQSRALRRHFRENDIFKTTKE